MKNIFFIISFIFSVTLFASKYYTATITLVNGVEKVGLATLPLNSDFGTRIRFKVNENAEKEVFKEKQISDIVYTSTNAHQYHIFRFCARPMSKKFHEVKKNEAKNKKYATWLNLVYSGENVEVFEGGEDYKFNKKGELYVYSSIFTIVFKYKADKCGGVMAINTTDFDIGRNMHFRKSASIFFKDYPELVKRIKNKEFKHSDYLKLIEAYENL